MYFNSKILLTNAFDRLKFIRVLSSRAGVMIVEIYIFDFSGMQDVPSTGLDKWYQLEARSQRSNIQGSLRLKLWLSTREDHGQACTQNHFDNWTDVRRHERLLTIFADYEMSLTKSVCQIISKWGR